MLSKQWDTYHFEGLWGLPLVKSIVIEIIFGKWVTSVNNSTTLITFKWAISTLSTSLKRGDLKGRRTRKTWKIPAGQPVFLNLLNDPFKPLEKLLGRLLEKWKKCLGICLLFTLDSFRPFLAVKVNNTMGELLMGK